ncbi:MAG: hypothetical protein JNM22_07620 [Saprospiraceae bacterium]|nr:hypothetical protein [Saprospiraceae bacterium]
MYRLFFIALFFSRCISNPEPSPQAPQPHPKSAVLLHDISITFKSAIQPDRSLFLNLGKEIAASGGNLAFGLIGSPDSTEQLIRQSFAMPPVLPPDLVHSERIRYQDSLAIINHYNDSLINVFADNCMEVLRMHSQKHAWTDVNKGLQRANEFFSELKMADTHKILILNTDGKQDVLLPNGTRDHTLKLDLIPAGTKSITCGWEAPTRISGAGIVESPGGLTEQIRLLTFK